MSCATLAMCVCMRFLPELQCLPFPPGLCHRWLHKPEPASAPQKTLAPKRYNCVNIWQLLNINSFIIFRPPGSGSRYPPNHSEVTRWEQVTKTTTEDKKTSEKHNSFVFWENRHVKAAPLLELECE